MRQQPIEAEAVLYISQPINEIFDPRTVGKKGPRAASLSGAGPGNQTSMTDWRAWSSAGFGQRLQGSLSSLGKGYSAEVTDFGQFVAVRASYHNTVTGKCVSKTYVVAFEDINKGDGRVMVTSQKWRTISSYDQAASYIISSIRNYSSQTSSI